MWFTGHSHQRLCMQLIPKCDFPIYKECLPISVLCFPALNLGSCSTLLRSYGPFNLSSIDFHARSPVMFWRGLMCQLSYYDNQVFPSGIVRMICKISRLLLHTVWCVYLTFSERVPARSPIFKKRTHYWHEQNPYLQLLFHTVWANLPQYKSTSQFQPLNTWHLLHG